MTPYFRAPFIELHQGNALAMLRELPGGSVNCCVTSPPYWGLRDYGTSEWSGGLPDCDHLQHHGSQGTSGQRADRAHPGNVPYKDLCGKCGARRVDEQIGLEPTPEAFVAKMVDVFREVRRVLRDDGTLWLNLGDSYCASGGNTGGASSDGAVGRAWNGVKSKVGEGLKPKDLVGIPWRVAFALQADGWYLRSDIIWCLSGGVSVYARTQKGDMPMTLKDLYRLKPATVKLWNGSRWTNLLGMSKSKRTGAELELVLRSGERISCTPNHRFPTNRGLVEARALKIGDILEHVNLPEPDFPKSPAWMSPELFWFAGLYLAEGSRMRDHTICLSGHIKESERWTRVRNIAEEFGGSATITNEGNGQTIRVYSRMLSAALNELVSGRVARDKGIAPVVWRYSNAHIRSLIDGYLSGDGGWDSNNGRWRLGFCRNYNLERDLRTACARLGYSLTLKPSTAKYQDGSRPSFRGELRKAVSGHHNNKDRGEIVAIRKSRCREVYDIGVEDEPHLFALSSGVLTHNSKPNPMPESVTDRPTKAHEYLFLLSKSERYHYDHEAIAEPAITSIEAKYDNGQNGHGGGVSHAGQGSSTRKFRSPDRPGQITRNRRSVWTINTQPFPEAHFATFPEDLVRPCILAGCPQGGRVLDPFAGAGTTLLVARALGCFGVGIELNREYCEMIKRRLSQEVLDFSPVQLG